MTTQTLWRAAPVDRPHFGQGSYWTPSVEFARRFRLWLDENFPREHTVYRADVEVTDALDIPFEVKMDSPVVTRRVPELAAAGYLWVTFYEGAFEGTISRQYVHLGEQPIAAECAS